MVADSEMFTGDSQLTLSVAEVNQAVKEVLEGFPLFQNLRIGAELGNFTVHDSGHWYFTLKDAKAQLSAVMFRREAQQNGFYDFKPGDSVEVEGSIGVWGARGTYQLYVRRMKPAGQGALFAKFLALKQKLEAAGLFSSQHKQPLPEMPRRVVVVTSATGAVLHDIVTTLRRRAPFLHLQLIPAAVQGAQAVGSLLAAIQLAEQVRPDVLVLARGGGSMEDLWCFNDERLAHALHRCTVPVISAIGHETDFSIADFVADVRAPTPTAAAEMLAKNQDELATELAFLRKRLATLVQLKINEEWMGLDEFGLRLQAALKNKVASRKQHLLQLVFRLQMATQHSLAHEREQLLNLRTKLEGLDIQATLARGFSLTLKDGKPVRKAKDVKPGDVVSTRLADGLLTSRVETSG